MPYIQLKNAPQFTPTMPISLLESFVIANYIDIREQRHNCYVSYYLLLAHDVLEEPDRYRKLFGLRNATPEPRKLPVAGMASDAFVILDNSLCELGEAMDTKDLLEAARIVDANVIILPDRMGDALGTIADSTLAAKRMLDINTNLRFMGVIQGENIPQLHACAQAFTHIPQVKYFGCPRWITNEIGTRTVFKEILGIHYNVRPYVHMLGMSKNVEDDIICASYPGVMGMDSANPAVAGQLQRVHGLSNRYYEHIPRTQEFDGGMKWDYWAEHTVTTDTLQNIFALQQAIRERWTSNARVNT